MYAKLIYDNRISRLLAGLLYSASTWGLAQPTPGAPDAAFYENGSAEQNKLMRIEELM